MYTFHAKEIRVRIKSLAFYPGKKTGELDPDTNEPILKKVELPPSINMNDEEQFMGSDLWEEYMY